MFSYIIKRVTYAEKSSQAEKNSHRDYKAYIWVMCLRKTNAITFHFLSLIVAGDDFKMCVQSCNINATHLSWAYRIICSRNINFTKQHLFSVVQATLYIMLKNEENSCEEFLQFVYHRAIRLARHLLMWSFKFKKIWV